MTYYNLLLSWAALAARADGAYNITYQKLFVSGKATAGATPWNVPGTTLVYRIPALTKTKSGTLIATVSERLGGSNDESETNIVQRRSVDGGHTWGKLTLVVLAKHGMSSSPWTMADSSTGDLLTFWNANSTSDQRCSCSVSATRSVDDGQTYSEPIALPASSGVVGSSLATGITLTVGGKHGKQGRLVTCMRRICKNSCPNGYASFAGYSDDHGKTWSSSSYLAAGTTECQITELSDGTLYLSSRPLAYKDGSSNRLSSRSTDGGTTWGAVKVEQQLPSYGGCAGSVVSDPATTGKTKTVYYSHPDAPGRNNMTVYISRDDAETWEETIDVDRGEGAYSSMALLNVSSLGLLYESGGYSSVTFATISGLHH